MPTSHSRLNAISVSLRLVSRQHIMLIATGAGLYAFIMLYRQPLYPAPWFDEGLNLSTAATLAREGLYALPDSAGPRVLDPAIQTGPTVLLPVALAFRLFGFGITQARLTMLVLATLTLASFALAARRLVGQAAPLAILLLLAGTLGPYTSFVYMGRQVLGEVPALGFYLLGLLIWWPSLDRRSGDWQGPVLAGLAWGAAMITKSQVMLTLPVCLGLVAVLDRSYYHRASWLAFIVPGAVATACVLLWYAIQMVLVGPDQFLRNALVLREGVTRHIIGLNPIHWQRALGVIWRSGWWLWGLPGIAWGLWQARYRTNHGFYHAVALALPVVWLCWFIGLSIGWERYAFYTFVLSPIWTAGLLTELWHGRLGPSPCAGRRLLAGGLIALYVIVNGRPLVGNLITPVDTGYLAMSDYLATQVSPDAIIESWAWEMDLTAPQRIHHPPTSVTNDYTVRLLSGQSAPSDSYDPLQVQPHYILEGPFSIWTGIYRQTRRANAQPVAHFGQYVLYQLQR